MCANMNHQDALGHSRIVAVCIWTLERLITGVRANMNLHVTLANSGVVATSERAVVDFRLYHMSVARAAVVTAVAMTLAIDTLWHVRRHR